MPIGIPFGAGGGGGGTAYGPLELWTTSTVPRVANSPITSLTSTAGGVIGPDAGQFSHMFLCAGSGAGAGRVSYFDSNGGFETQGALAFGSGYAPQAFTNLGTGLIGRANAGGVPISYFRFPVPFSVTEIPLIGSQSNGLMQLMRFGPHSNTVYILANDTLAARKIWTSGDDGITFNAGGIAVPDMTDFCEIEDGVLLGVSGATFLYRSNDYGATWATTAPFPAQVIGIRQANNIIFAFLNTTAANPGYTSFDAGVTWIPWIFPMHDFFRLTTAFCRAGPVGYSPMAQRYFAQYGNKLVIVSDDGVNWRLAETVSDIDSFDSSNAANQPYAQPVVLANGRCYIHRRGALQVLTNVT